MFNVGDKVVYPLHGAGTINSIQKKEISNTEKYYYSFTIPFRKLEILIPVENGEELGLRNIIGLSEIKEIEETLMLEAVCKETNWNRRYRDNLELLKTGDYLNVAAVVRELYRLDNKKPLATGEKKMLNNAKSILASEIALVNGENEEEIMLWMKERVFSTTKTNND